MSDLTPASGLGVLSAEDRAILAAVRREMAEREGHDGNAPGHCHDVPGIWDSDNGAIAGTPCAWCLTWSKFTALVDALPAADAEGALPARVLAMCKARGWSLHWTHRGAYLHLESSELIEALRGKRGDPLGEAADVLLVLMSITEANDIAWQDVLDQCARTVERLETSPRYPGEQFDAAAPPPAGALPGSGAGGGT